MSRAWHKMKRRLRQLEAGAAGECDAKLRSMASKHEQELARRTEKVQSLLEKIAKTHWHYDYRGGSYAVQIMLNPDVLGGVSMYRDDLRFLAQRIGRQVEREIASGHFVQAAYQSEYDRLPPLRRVPQ